MAFHGFGGSHNTLILRGKTKLGLKREVRLWAERGLIHCEDSLDNSYRSMSVRQFLHRINGMNEMVGNTSSKRDKGFDVQLRAEIQRNVQQAMALAELAKIQGMPEDASARRDRARRQKKTVCVTDRRAIM
jgi:hypothetical protein